MTDKSKTQLEAASKVDDAEKALTAITETEKGIAKLKEQYGGVVFEVGTTKGMDEAKKARAEIRAPRYTIENLRKAAKAPILALGKTVDSIARDLTAEVLKIETPIDEQIKAEEKRKEDARLARIKAEEERIASHREAIDAMLAAVGTVVNDRTLTPEQVAACIDIHKNRLVTDVYEEFQEAAQAMWDQCLQMLQEHHAAMVARVEQEQRLAEQEAELEQLRKEKEERDAADKKAAEEEAERQRLVDEAARIAEQDRQLAEPKPVEEQLADLSFGTQESDPVETTPAPDPVEDAVVAAIPPDPRVPPYPGQDVIVAAVAQQLGVGTEIATHWLHKYVAEALEKLGVQA